jgi:hypothetical protein
VSAPRRARMGESDPDESDEDRRVDGETGQVVVTLEIRVLDAPVGGCTSRHGPIRHGSTSFRARVPLLELELSVSTQPIQPLPRRRGTTQTHLLPRSS